MITKQKTQGVTLLESMLVLVIMGGLLAVGVAQYQSLKLSSDIEQLKYNIDMVSQAAAYYFYANCNSGTLAPTITTDPMPLTSVQTDLVDAGYLTVKLPNNPLITTDPASPWSAYKVQFNRYTTDRTVCVAGASGNCTTYSKIGTIVGWQIQISVQLKNLTLANQLLILADATCLTSATDAGVKPCAGAGAGAGAESITGDYLSFARGPSFSTALEGQSGLNMYNQTLLQFKQMYDTYPVTDLLSNPTATGSGSQYFYCGG